MGTSVSRIWRGKCHEDHPHAYGDKFEMLPLVSLSIGSSPRVWGQVVFPPCPLGCLRIIPTRMGTSFDFLCTTLMGRDHPHAYGDKGDRGPQYVSVGGSSPRVWGQAVLDALLQGKSGIIPTRVGTSKKCPGHSTASQDHPHACGDKASAPLSGERR